MKLEDLYPENRALVVKKIEDTENDYLVAGKGVVTGVVTIPGCDLAQALSENRYDFTAFVNAIPKL